MADDYETARLIVEAAPSAQFVLPEYTGGTHDLAALKEWVLGVVTEAYGVESSLFNEATVVSTTILRDFVHRALYQVDTPFNYATVFASPEFQGFDDVALAFRYPIHGLCSEMAWQLWSVYRAFGYQTNDVATINGPVDSFTDSHTTSQVFVSDLGKYIVQDATFNFAYRDANGTLLSLYEARDANLESQLVFDGFADYRSYYENGVPDAEIPLATQDYFRDNYLETIAWWYDATGTRTSLLAELFLDSAQAHNAAVSQGGEFVSQASAIAAVESLGAGANGWVDIASALRGDGYYVSGFATADETTGSHTSEWLTVRLATGEYISINIADSTVLRGSFDQISDELFGGTVRNPGADLSALADNVFLLNAAGVVMNSGVAPPIPNDIIGSADADNLSGTSGVDRLIGLAGDDILHSNGSGDYLAGGDGDDTYFVSNNAVQLLEISGEGYDTIYASGDTILPENFEILNLTGSAISGTGNTGEYWISGNNQDNVITALSGVGHLYGGAGNDTYYVGSDASVVVEYGGDGFDRIFSTASVALDAASEVEFLATYGSSTTQVINFTGSNIANRIEGNSAANVLNGGAGADTMWGYGGDDTYYVDNVGDRVTELASEGYDTIYSTASVTLDAASEVEALLTYGSSTTQVINFTGSNIANRIEGNAAANVLNGGAGADTMWGYGGDDIYYVDNVGDRVIELAGGGFDRIYATASVTLDATSEVEYLATYGSSTTQVINFTGGNIANRIEGNAAANVLNGGAGADTMWGYGGNDTYYVENVGDRVIELAGEGVDTLYSSVNFVLPDNVEVLNLYGAALNGTGNTSAYWIYGNANANVFYTTAGGSGHLNGGGGNDTYFVSSAADTVSELAGEGIDTVYSAVDSGLPFSEVEVLNLTGAAVVGRLNAAEYWIYGNANNNILYATFGDSGHLYGGTGNDIYYLDGSNDTVFEVAGEGSDTVYSSADVLLPFSEVEVLNLTGAALTGRLNTLEYWIYGNDNANTLYATSGGKGHLNGGLGGDTYYLDGSNDSVFEAAGQGSDTVYSSADVLLPINNVEVLNLTGAAVSGRLSASEYWIFGNANNNILYATSGNSGHLYGGAGNDIYYLDGSNDSVSEAAGEGSDTVYSSADVLLPFNEVEVLNLTGSAVTGRLSTSEYWIYGNGNDNTLYATAGVSGHLHGGLGNDNYYVDGIGDTVHEALNSGTDTVYASTDYTLSDNVEILNMQAGAVNGTGNSGENYLYGNADANTLNGGAGADQLWGLGGRDTFVLADFSRSADGIGDFVSGFDTIALDHVAIGMSTTGSLAAAGIEFVVGTAATSTAPTLFQNSNTGSVYWDLDGTGSGAAVRIVDIRGAVALTADDFLLI